MRFALPVFVRILCLLLLFYVSCFADPVGSIFVTGHDPDFHGQDSIGLPHGAAHLLQVGMDFVRNGRSGKFLLVGGLPGCLTDACAPAGHFNPVQTLNELGLVTGTDFDIATAVDIPAAALDSYAFVMVESDFGGLLTADALHNLALRSADIAAYLNSGGGVFAMAESGSGSGAFATDPAERFGFLPTVLSSATLNQSESGFNLTAFGSTLGLDGADINGDFSHNIFTDTAGLDVVDRDSAGHIITLAGRVSAPATSVPEPNLSALLAIMALVFCRRAHKKTPKPNL
ncbi:MAG TPA: hypothetical protein VNH18_36355 [Bryobacteraceae bacterium]|nr:hypothetical protein [Bryobacteraceae bacterium]HXJ44817.1 hypothetical protein [Bryobacteraceae bacterium]